MSEWIIAIVTPANIAWLIVIMLSALLGVVTAKWRGVLSELKDFFEKYKIAQEDGKLTKAEREMLVKEAFEVILQIIRVWVKI